MAKRKKGGNLGLLISLLVLVGLVAGYGGYWYVSTLLVRQNVADWVAGQRMEGWQTSLGSVSISGFPFDLNVKINNLIAQSPSGWGISLPAIDVKISPFWPYALKTALPASFNVATPTTGWMSVSASTSSEVTLTLGRRSRLEAVDLQANNLQISTPLNAYRLQSLSFSGKYLGVSLRRSNRPTLSFDLTARGFTLPDSVQGGMSRTISSLILTGRIIGNVPGGPIDGALALWRDNNGSLELLRADLDWPPLRLSSSGTLSLDSQMQPVGTGVGTAQNVQQTFERMVESGFLSGSDATMARYALGLLNNQAKAQKNLSVSLSIQDGQFYTGSAPLFKVPTVSWSDPGLPAPPSVPIVPAVRPAVPSGPTAETPSGDSGPIVVAPQQRR